MGKSELIDTNIYIYIEVYINAAREKRVLPAGFERTVSGENDCLLPLPPFFTEDLALSGDISVVLIMLPLPFDGNLSTREIGI